MSAITVEQFERLERQVRRLRGLVLVMALGIAGVLTLGATGKPDELTLRRLAIVDAEGRERIVAGTSLDGTASLSLLDRNEYKRIYAATLTNGAGVTLSDRDDKPRITAGTLDNGGATLAFKDSDGNARIVAGTNANGSATVIHADRDGKMRIAAGTRADGAADINLLDRGENLTWTKASK